MGTRILRARAGSEGSQPFNALARYPSLISIVKRHPRITSAIVLGALGVTTIVAAVVITNSRKPGRPPGS